MGSRGTPAWRHLDSITHISSRFNFPLSWCKISSYSTIEINVMNKEIVSWEILNKLIKGNKGKERKWKETKPASIG